MRIRTIPAALPCAVFVACGSGNDAPAPAPGNSDDVATASGPVREELDTQRLSAIVKVLASDEFEGRAPGTAGEARTVEYLIEQFSSLGLEPGGESASWTQTVPMIHTRIESPARMEFTVAGKSQPLEQKVDIEASTVRSDDHVAIDAPVVFIGFGACAPERDWDDFGEIDLNGKVVLFLVNDPDFAAPHLPRRATESDGRRRRQTGIGQNRERGTRNKPDGFGQHRSSGTAPLLACSRLLSRRRP